MSRHRNVRNRAYSYEDEGKSLRLPLHTLYTVLTCPSPARRL